jgi:uncharacterized RDD family membrane protein YckC
MPVDGPGSLVGVGVRFVGAFVDFLICTLIVLLPLRMAGLVKVTTTGSGSKATQTIHASLGVEILLAVMPVLIIVVLLAVWGQTIGMRLFRMRLVRYLDGTKPSFSQCLIRTVVLFGGTLIGFLGFIGPIISLAVGFSASFDAVLRGWQDKAAGTIVLRTSASPRAVAR